MLFVGMDITAQTKGIIYDSFNIMSEQMGEDSEAYEGYKLGVINTLLALEGLLDSQDELIVHIRNKENIQEYIDVDELISMLEG